MTSEFIVAFIGGALAFFSPCILGALPSLLATIGSGGAEPGRMRMRYATLFVTGFSVAFIVIGAGVGLLARQLVPLLGTLSTIFGLALLVLGVVMVVGLERVARLPLLASLMRTVRASGRITRSDRLRKWKSLRALLVGLGFGLAWTPCIGPILTGILIIAANSGSVVFSTSLLATFSAGMAIPFLLAAAVSAKIFHRLARHGRKLEILSGVIFAGYGVLMVTGRLAEVVRFLTEHMPDITEWYRG